MRWWAASFATLLCSWRWSDQDPDAAILHSTLTYAEAVSEEGDASQGLRARTWGEWAEDLQAEAEAKRDAAYAWITGTVDAAWATAPQSGPSPAPPPGRWGGTFWSGWAEAVLGTLFNLIGWALSAATGTGCGWPERGC